MNYFFDTFKEIYKKIYNNNTSRCIKIFIRDASDVLLWIFFYFKLNSILIVQSEKTIQSTPMKYRFLERLKRFTTSRCIKTFVKDTLDSILCFKLNSTLTVHSL